jgi:hypothetical protein
MLAAGKSAASYHLLPTSPKEKNFQEFPKMLAAGKPIYWNAIQKKEKNFFKKRLDKNQKVWYTKIRKE